MNTAVGSSRLRSDRFLLSALFLAALAFYLLVFNRGFNVVDEGHFLMHADLMRKGFLPFRDFYFQHAPLSFWIQALLFRIFEPAIIVNRIYALIQFLALIPLLYAVSRALAAPPYAAIPPAIFIGFSLGFARTGFYSIDAVAVDLLTLGALILFFQRGRLTWLFAAGLLAGICFCMHQNAGGAAALTTVFAVILVVKAQGRRAPWWGLLGSLAAGLIAPLLVLLVFVKDGLALEFLKAVFLAGGTKSWVWRQIPRLILPVAGLFGLYLWAMLWWVRKAIRLPTPRARSRLRRLVLIHLAALAVVLAKGAGPMVLNAVVGMTPLGLAGLSLYALRSEPKLDQVRQRVILIAVVFVLMMMGLGILSGFDLGHNLLDGIWSLTLLGYLSQRLAQAVPESWRNKLHWALAGATVGFLLLGILLSLDNPTHPLSEEPLYQQTLPLNLPRGRGIRVSPLLKQEAEGIVAVVQRETRPEDHILVFPLGDMYYFLADRVPGTYWNFFFFENFQPQDAPAAIEQIERSRIRLVILTDPQGKLGSLLLNLNLRQVYAYILDHYQPGERYGRYLIYRRK